MNNFILIGLVILNPFLSIFINIYSLIKKNKQSVFLSALSISIIFIYMPIMYDTSNNYYYTYYLSKMNYKLNEIRLYNLIPILLARIDLDYMITIFIYTFIIFFVKFKFLYESIKKRKIKEEVLYISILFLSTIIYREIMDLNRFYLGISLFFFGTLIVKNKLYKILLLLLAIKFHSSLSFLVLLFLIYDYLPSFSFLIEFAMSLILIDLKFFLSEVVKILQIFSLKLSYKLNNYIYHETWGYRTLFEVGLKKSFQKLLILLLLYLIYIYLKRYASKDRMFKFYQYSLLLNILTFNFFTLFERFSISTLFLGIILISKIKINLNKDLILLSTIFLLAINNFIWVNFVEYRNVFTKKYYILNNHSKKEEIIMNGISLNLFSLLNIKKNGYSDEQIKSISNRGREYISLIRNGVKKEIND